MKFISDIQTTVKAQSKHKIVAITYVCAMAIAFILSSARNSSVNASVSNESIKYIQAFEEESQYGMTFINDYVDSNLVYLENVKNILKDKEFDEDFSIKQVNKFLVREIEVSKGDNFISILTQKIGLSYNEATKVINGYKKIFDPRSLKVGQKIRFNVVHENNSENKLISLEKVIIEPKSGHKYVLVKNINNEYVSNIIVEELIDEVVTARGKIIDTLSRAMSEANVPSQISASFTNIFSFTVDFRRDVRPGDEFEIIYENRIDSEGRVIKTGDIKYASIKLRKDKLSLYRFEDSNKNVDYYDENGVALKRTLHRKPLALQKARVSSPFGKRRHPILKTVKVHWGIDYAAPRGTPIFAAGDGVVQMARYNGAYGNYIKIRHNSEYSTAYGHMHKFAPGMRSGMRVKQGQIIGYVGNTGRSTGPHLHYEVIKNGKRVNPRTITAATGENLKGKILDKFKKEIATLKNENPIMFAKNEEEKIAQK